MAISLVRLTNKLFFANLLSAFSASFLSVTAEVSPATQPKIGVILPLSGEAASYGQQFRRGMDLNSEYSNFKLVFEDSKFETKTAVTAFNKLVELDHVNYLVSFGGATCEVINERAQRARLLHLAAGCNTGDFITPDSSNFRMDVNETNAAKHSAKYLKATGRRTVAMLSVNNSWAEVVVSKTKQALKDEHLEITSEYKFEEGGVVDLRSEISRIKMSKPDVIFLVSLPNLTAIVLKQIHGQGYYPSIMSNISVENPEVIEKSGDHANGIFYVSVKPNLRSAELDAKFKKEFPTGNPFAAWGFDSLSLLRFANTQTDPIRSLQGLKDFLGVFNLYNFSSTGELELTYEVREIKDGSFVLKSESRK